MIKGTWRSWRPGGGGAAVLLGRGKGVNEVARLVGARPPRSAGGRRRCRSRARPGRAQGLAAPWPQAQAGPGVRQASPGRVGSRDTPPPRGTPTTCGPAGGWLRSDRWTFAVWYDPDHVWKILQGLGWSSQKPEVRARERDEKAIKALAEEGLAANKKRGGVLTPPSPSSTNRASCSSRWSGVRGPRAAGP